MTWKRGLAMAAAGLALALAGGPAASQDDEPTARLIFVKSYDRGAGLGEGTRQQYFLLPNGDCRGKRRQALFNFLTGAETVRELPAGQPLKFWAITQHFTPGTTGTCEIAFSFTPRAGATYRVALAAQVYSHCEVVVTDEATGNRVEDLEADKGLVCQLGFQLF